MKKYFARVSGEKSWQNVFSNNVVIYDTSQNIYTVSLLISMGMHDMCVVCVPFVIWIKLNTPSRQKYASSVNNIYSRKLTSITS